MVIDVVVRVFVRVYVRCKPDTRKRDASVESGSRKVEGGVAAYVIDDEEAGRLEE